MNRERERSRMESERRKAEQREREEQQRALEEVRQQIENDRREREQRRAERHSPRMEPPQSPLLQQQQQRGVKMVIRDGKLTRADATATADAEAKLQQQLSTPGGTDTEGELPSLDFLDPSEVSKSDLELVRAYLLARQLQQRNAHRQKPAAEPAVPLEQTRTQTQPIDTAPSPAQPLLYEAAELKADASTPVVNIAIRLHTGERSVLRANCTATLQQLYSHAAWLLASRAVHAPKGFVLRTTPPGAKILLPSPTATLQSEHLANSAIQIELDK